MEDITHISTNIKVLNKASAVVVDKGGKKARKTEAKDQPNTVDSARDWALWGNDNMYPQNVLEDVQKSTMIGRLLELRTALHYGEGIYPYRLNIDESTGKMSKMPIWPRNIRQFFKVNRLPIQYSGIIQDYEYWAMAGAEIILSNDRTRIKRVFHHDMAMVRWGEANKKTGKIDKAYISPNWANPGLREYTELPLLDPDYALEQINQQTSKYKFFFPIFKKTPDRSYYHEPSWHSARKSEWVKIAKKVPELKKYLFENQMSIKYHVRIHEQYWTSKYKNWPNMTDQQKSEAQEETMKEINEMLVGLENTGKTIFSGTATDRQGNTIHGLEIEVLADKFKEGSYLPDATAANQEIAFAIGVDPTLIGMGIPGGNNLSGSGSDKRESKFIHQSQLPRDRAHTLDLMYFIADFNGWDPDYDIEWDMMDKDLTTLDKNPTGRQNSM